MNGVARALVAHRRWLTLAVAAGLSLLLLTRVGSHQRGGDVVGNAPSLRGPRTLDLTGNTPAWAAAAQPEGMARFQRAHAQEFTAVPQLATLPVRGTKVHTASRSQHGEDIYAYEHFFFGRGGGTFLEMGALNGLQWSNTVALERAAGWRGVLIEASPSSYSQLAANRPDQITVHTAVCDKHRTVHYLDDGMACCRGIAEFMSQGFLERRHPAVAAQGFAGLPQVPCLPLSAILSHLRVQHVNLFFLDVEGAELMVLQSLDFGAVSFDVIAVEQDGSNPGKDQAVIDLLQRNGYTYHGHVLDEGTAVEGVRQNDWFVRQGFQPSAKPIAELVV